MSTSQISQTTRKRLRMQGYACPRDDPEFTEIVPWLRFSTGLCGVWILVGTVFASPTLLGVLVPIAAFGAVHERHPFDYLYNHGIRHLTGTKPLPPNGAPRRFACLLAAFWLGAMAVAFWNGALLVGYVLGALIIVVNVVVNVTDFCLPSFIYRKTFDKMEVF